MGFKEIQKGVFELIQKGDSSAGSYLSIFRNLPKSDKSLPSYVRKINVAFLSNFTLQGLPEIFKTQAVFHNLWVNTYLAPYNQYAQEILNPKSKLYKFKPNLVFLLLDPEDSDKDQLIALGSQLAENSGAKVIIFNKDFDFESFLSKIGKKKYWNTKYKKLGDLRLSPGAFPLLANAIMGYAIAMSGATKKCLVIDLDNTLWQGIVGEDSFKNIVPDKKLQQHLLDLYNRGIVLAINSRNNEADSLDVIERNPGMLLNKNHFAGRRINWQDKATNMSELAQELNLGLDSFVFIDDDPFQQNLVRESLPAVTVLAPKNLYDYPGFTSSRLTAEDKKRGKMYVQEKTRKKFQSSLKSVEDFLSQLNMKAVIKKADGDSIERVAQLTQRTNQFNLATRRYSEGNIKKFTKAGWQIWTIDVTDRFGDYGIIGLAMIEPAGQTWRIDNFLLSCRILGRGVERALLAHLIESARGAGISKVIGEFIPTVKNKPAQSFYSDNGFKLVSKQKGLKLYEHDLKKIPDSPKHIKEEIL